MKRRSFLQACLGAVGIGTVGVPKPKSKPSPSSSPTTSTTVSTGNKIATGMWTDDENIRLISFPFIPDYVTVTDVNTMEQSHYFDREELTSMMGFSREGQIEGHEYHYVAIKS